MNPTQDASAWSLTKGHNRIVGLQETNAIHFSKMGLEHQKAQTPPSVSMWQNVHHNSADPPEQFPFPARNKFMGRKHLTAEHPVAWDTGHATRPHESFQESPWLYKRRDPVKFQTQYVVVRPSTGAIIDEDPRRYDPLLHSSYYIASLEEGNQAEPENMTPEPVIDVRQRVKRESEYIGASM